MSNISLLTSTDKQDRKQTILSPSKSANRPTQEPVTPIVHTQISSVNEVRYAQLGAMYQPPLIPQEVLSPSVSTQYQGFRASGVDMISAYNTPQVWKHEHIGGEVKVQSMLQQV